MERAEKQLGTYTFWEEYKKHIGPKVAAIDVFLKTAEYPLDITSVARLLSLSHCEILNIMAKLNAKTIDKQTFLGIMEAGTSRLCRLFCREVELQSPITYTSEDIAYIYNLDHATVKTACQNLKIKEVTAFTMPLVFAKIPY
jgi:hypothetical protein